MVADVDSNIDFCLLRPASVSGGADELSFAPGVR
jgi:hypothetical protein